jgi:hypothetical protein
MDSLDLFSEISLTSIAVRVIERIYLRTIPEYHTL